MIGPDSLFLVTGGARGITARCVIAMAQRYRCRFILIGRTHLDEEEPDWARGAGDLAELRIRLLNLVQKRGEAPSPQVVHRAVADVLARREIAATLYAVEAAGARARYFSVDITNRSLLQEATRQIEREEGPIDGIIHAAGTIADRRIEHKTAADFDATLAPKVEGLANLLSAVPPDRLSTLILFSSIAAVYGNPGQADYAVANEVLNRAAPIMKARAPRCRVVSVSWGPWAGGMVSAGHVKRFAADGIPVISPGEGASTFLDLLGGLDDAPAQAVIGPGGRMPARVGRPSPHAYRIHRTLSLAEDPFLRDHSVGGNAVLPLLGAAAWLSNVCEGLFPGYRTLHIEDVRVLKGIVLRGDDAAEYIVEVTEPAEESEDTAVLATSIRGITSGGAERLHYRATVRLSRHRPASPLLDGFDLSEDAHAVDGSTFHADGTLFHGPAFTGVRRILNASERRITARCVKPELEPGVMGRFPIQTIDPIFLDIAAQPLLVWSRLYRGTTGMPASCSRIEQYRDVHPGETFYSTVEVRESQAHRLLTDITAHDEAGRVWAQGQGVELILKPSDAGTGAAVTGDYHAASGVAGARFTLPLAREDVHDHS